MCLVDFFTLTWPVSTTNKIVAYHKMAVLIGKSLKLHHYRRTDKCGGVEELKPIDQNLNYNVEYQVNRLIMNFLPFQSWVVPKQLCVRVCVYTFMFILFHVPASQSFPTRNSSLTCELPWELAC